MLSQNVSKTTVPSYYMIRTNLPHRKPNNQWEGVYYYSGITKRQQHILLLQRKRARAEELKIFNSARASLLAQFEATAAAAQQQPTGSTSQQRYQLAHELARHGLYTQAMSFVEALHHEKKLNVGQYVQLLSGLSADRLRAKVLRTDAAEDPSLTFKLLGDEAGDARAAEAYRLYDWAMAALSVQCYPLRVSAERTAAATQLTNALMRTLLTCGYTHVSSVPNAIYDRMGAAGITPTITSYEQVMTALALMGNNVEAEEILAYLRQHHHDHVTINSYNALLLGHREAKAFDRCDALWQELVDRRWPRPTSDTAELYLRSIIDHSYTPMSEPLQRFGDVNVLEKKKIPIVLTHMDDLGIPRTHLSRHLLDEVEDALRKFSIYKTRFYEWGRAVKQFDFIEFRRRHGWLYDLQLMKNTTKNAPGMRDPTQPDATMAPVATAEIPAFFTERHAWEMNALDPVLTLTETKERTDDVRAGDIYYDDTKRIHDRGSNWMNQVPETRYDQLYGINNPDIAKIGIRRHLEVEYVNQKETRGKDAAILRRTLSSGRRLRQRVDHARTHRTEGSFKSKNR